MDFQLKANVENQDRAKCGKNDTGGMKSSGCGGENMWVTAPPMIDPMMPSTIVQKIVMCTCITDFAITPAINPTTMYQIK